MTVIVNTTDNKDITKILEKNLFGRSLEYEIFEASDMHISHCRGCNFCWLKTPGVCAIKDDYEKILKELPRASQLWVISDTALGFLNHKGKNIFDRILPLLTMNLEFRDKVMRHVMRYDNRLDIGIIYQGGIDKDYMIRWNKKITDNMKSKPIGVFDVGDIMEATKCMQ